MNEHVVVSPLSEATLQYRKTLYSGAPFTLEQLDLALVKVGDEAYKILPHEQALTLLHTLVGEAYQFGVSQMPDAPITTELENLYLSFTEQLVANSVPLSVPETLPDPSQMEDDKP